MAADAANELESLANAALLLALEALLGGGRVESDGNSFAAGKALDRLLLSGMRAYDAANGQEGVKDVETTATINATFEDGADATVRS